MKRLFVDASYWIALELSDDQYHLAARAHWGGLDFLQIRLVTTTYIMDEAATFLNSRKAHQNAVSLGENIMSSRLIELVHVDEDLFSRGWEIFVKYSDKTFSLTDCISFVVMTERQILTALSFDGDFTDFGLLTEPL